MSSPLQTLSKSLQLPHGGFAPYGFPRGLPTPTSLSNYITPVQFQRLAHDIKMWREAIIEAELAWYPMRVRMQRMYMDVYESPIIKPFLLRWLELNLQRDWSIYQLKGGKRIQSDDLTDQLNEQAWFADYFQYVMESQLFGYKLIELGDIVNDGFPNISFTRPENIRPDSRTYDNNRQQPIVTSLIYMLDGVHIKEDPLLDMCNHWIPTKTNRGVSSCGYGLLYNISLLEIHLRHVLEWNVDYVEMFGQPIKKGFTNKIGKARQAFEQFLASAGSNAYVLLDKGTGDDVSYEMASNAGTAWKSYDNLTERLEGVVSQILLGHTDAIKSVPGKLGGMQAANKDGFNESLVEQAMNAKQTTSGDFACRAINEIGAPRFRRLGKYVKSKLIENLIPEGYKFGLLNDKEDAEIRRRRNASNQVESTVMLNLYNAGLKMSAEDASKYMGLSLSEVIPEKEIIQKRENIKLPGDNPSPGENIKNPQSK